MRFSNTACAMMALAGMANLADAATAFNVVNNTNGALTVSDLIVFDWGGTGHVILRPNDPTDDVVIPAGGRHRFVSALNPNQIARIIVSSPRQVGGVLIDNEWVADNTYGSAVLNPTFFRPETDRWNDHPLHAYAGDDVGAMLDLPAGTRLFFSNGQSSSAPGLEVGTEFDYEEGAVWSYYTGWAVVIANNLTIQLEETFDCAADLDGDGDADAEDFFLYLDYFAEGYTDGCDIDGDGDCDAGDFFGYLDQFAMGC